MIQIMCFSISYKQFSLVVVAGPPNVYRGIVYVKSREITGAPKKIYLKCIPFIMSVSYIGKGLFLCPILKSKILGKISVFFVIEPLRAGYPPPRP